MEKYAGSEQEALGQLAQDLRRLGSRTTALEEQLSPRTLSPEEISLIARRVQVISGIKVHFLLIASDPEARSFKGQIENVLETGGWTIEKDVISVTGAFDGLTLFASQDPPSDAVRALYLGLRESGFAPELVRDATLPRDTIRIRIGKKK